MKFFILLQALLIAGALSGLLRRLAEAQDCGCSPDLCCSQWGYCGRGIDFCGEGCKQGPCFGNNDGGVRVEDSGDGGADGGDGGDGGDRGGDGGDGGGDGGDGGGDGGDGGGDGGDGGDGGGDGSGDGGDGGGDGSGDGGDGGGDGGDGGGDGGDGGVDGGDGGDDGEDGGGDGGDGGGDGSGDGDGGGDGGDGGGDGGDGSGDGGDGSGDGDRGGDGGDGGDGGGDDGGDGGDGGGDGGDGGGDGGDGGGDGGDGSGDGGDGGDGGGDGDGDGGDGGGDDGGDGGDGGGDGGNRGGDGGNRGGDGGHGGGHGRGHGGGTVGDIVTPAFFDGIASKAGVGCAGKGFYTRDAFLSAAGSFPDFGTTGDNDVKKREIAAFFAQVTHETGHFCYIEEIAKRKYCQASHKYPCNPDKKYFGRGPLQLTWNYNYIPAGKAIGFDGLSSPETVANDNVISFKAALWFWDVNGVHKAITSGQGFGATTRIINSHECDGKHPQQMNARVGYYKDYCKQLGVSPGDHLTCDLAR